MFTETTLTIFFIAACAMLVIVNIDYYGAAMFYTIGVPLSLREGCPA